MKVKGDELNVCNIILLYCLSKEMGSTGSPREFLSCECKPTKLLTCKCELGFNYMPLCDRMM